MRQTRKGLLEDLRRLSEEALPRLARETGQYPVRFDHCFKRIAYDYAAGEKWDQAVDRPFYKNASIEQLQTALEALERMEEDPGAAEVLNDQSLSYR